MGVIMRDVDKLIELFKLMEVAYSYNGRWLVAAGRNYKIDSSGQIAEITDLIKPTRKLVVRGS